MKKFSEYLISEAKSKNPSVPSEDVYFWLPIIDENDGYGIVDKSDFSSGNTNLSKGEMNKLKQLDRDIEYITSITIADKDEDGNTKDRSGIEWFYVKLFDSEIKKLKLKGRGEEKESNMSDHISQAQRPKTKYNDWLNQNNYGTLRRGQPAFEYISNLLDKTTKELLSHIKKINPADMWKKAQALTSNNKNLFVHVSSNEYSVGDTIKAYRTDADIEDLYSGGSRLDQLTVTNMEAAFEDGRPSNKPSRKNCVYAFRDINDAKSWQQKFNARYIYVLQPSSGYSIHDMGAIDRYEDVSMSDFFEIDADDEEAIKAKEDELEQIVKDYWAGKQVHPYDPKYEVLIKNSAKVVFKAKVL